MHKFSGVSTPNHVFIIRSNFSIAFEYKIGLLTMDFVPQVGSNTKIVSIEE